MSPDELRAWIRDVPDFPEPGILFRDVTPLLADANAFRAAVDAVAAPFRETPIDRVLGIESRGFLFGAPVALALGTGFGLIRKSGKLPWRTLRVDYALEYGTDSVEMHEDAVAPGERVLLVDDLIATGGTAAAALELARRAGGEIVGCAFLVELEALGGRARLEGLDAIHSVIRY